MQADSLSRSLSLNSYLQTGARQGGTLIREMENERRGRSGNDEDLQRGSKKVTLFLHPPLSSLSLLHWSGNDRFHSCVLLLWRGSGVRLSGGGPEDVMGN